MFLLFYLYFIFPVEIPEWINIISFVSFLSFQFPFEDNEVDNFLPKITIKNFIFAAIVIICCVFVRLPTVVTRRKRD